MNDISFVIPTCRIRHVDSAIRSYSAHFQKYGHNVPVFIFDDSDIETSEKYAGSLSVNENPGGIFYIGPKEKMQFLDTLESETSIDKNLLKSIFRPSYGGNRNFTLAYTQDEKFISADDDMRSYGIYYAAEIQPENDEISRGIFVDNDDYLTKHEKDIIAECMQFLGKNVCDVQHVQRGETIESNMTDFYTNTTVVNIVPKTVEIIRLSGKGKINPFAKIKFVQSYITKSPDIDVKDYIDYFLRDQIFPGDDISLTYAIQKAKPVIVSSNWKFTPACTAFHNTELPPFIPTDLRYEDFVARVWIGITIMWQVHILELYKAILEAHITEVHLQMNI